MKLCALVPLLLLLAIVSPRAEKAAPPAEPSSRLVERIEDKLHRKLSATARAKILATEKEVETKTAAAHAAYLKAVGQATGIAPENVNKLLPQEDMLTSKADDTLVAEVEKTLGKPLKSTAKRSVRRAVTDYKLAVQPLQAKLDQAVTMYSGLRRDQAEAVLRGE